MTYKKGSRGPIVRQIQIALHLYPDGIFGPLTEERVIQFQKENNLTPDGIVGPLTLAKLLPFRLKKSKRTINEIIVHCTATPELREYSVADIRRCHLKRGFSDIGYHYVIHLDGTIEPGRDVDLSGAHCSYHNAHSIGISYIGGVAADCKTPKDTRTQAQKDALAAILEDLHALYPKATLHGHREFANKACPSFNVHKDYDHIFKKPSP